MSKTGVWTGIIGGVWWNFLDLNLQSSGSYSKKGFSSDFIFYQNQLHTLFPETLPCMPMCNSYGNNLRELLKLKVICLVNGDLSDMETCKSGFQMLV